MSIKHFEGLRFPKDAVAHEVDAYLSSLRSGAQPPAAGSRLQAVHNQHNEAVAALCTHAHTPEGTTHGMRCMQIQGCNSLQQWRAFPLFPRVSAEGSTRLKIPRRSAP